MIFDKYYQTTMIYNGVIQIRLLGCFLFSLFVPLLGPIQIHTPYSLLFIALHGKQCLREDNSSTSIVVIQPIYRHRLHVENLVYKLWQFLTQNKSRMLVTSSTFIAGTSTTSTSCTSTSTSTIGIVCIRRVFFVEQGQQRRRVTKKSCNWVSAPREVGRQDNNGRTRRNGCFDSIRFDLLIQSHFGIDGLNTITIRV